MNQLEKKFEKEMKSVKDRVTAEINRQAKEFMQSEAMKNGFRGSTAAKNRACRTISPRNYASLDGPRY